MAESLSARLREQLRPHHRCEYKALIRETVGTLEAQALKLDACIEALRDVVAWREGPEAPEFIHDAKPWLKARAVLARLSPSTDKGAAPTPKGGTRE